VLEHFRDVGISIKRLISENVRVRSKAKKEKEKNQAHRSRAVGKVHRAAKELGLDETSGEAFERAMDSLTKPGKNRSN
jgi:hypothetical protein